MTTINLRLGPVNPIRLNVVDVSPIILRSVPAVGLSVSTQTMNLQVSHQPINLRITGVGAQGPPGSAGNQFETTNREGAAIVPGAPVATHSTGVGIVLANATNASKPCIGLNVESADDEAGATIQTSGPFELDDWTAITGATELAPKAIYFLSSTGGLLTMSSPTASPNISQRVGKAVSPTILDIDPWGFVQL